MSVDIFNGGKLIPLMEQFYTIQGEGFQTGKPAYFIRVGGCDIGCSWCDSKFSWQSGRHPLVKVDEILQNALNAGAKSLVVTGGEPSLYNMDYLTDVFRSAGLDLFLETSGAYSLSGKWDWICLSPKRRNPPKAEFFAKAGELKVIIQTIDDIEWARENAEKVNSKAKLFLQPEWSERDKILPHILAFVKRNVEWRLSLQTHKYIGIP
ncbi:MAG: 7-carboxy-7-deazaguanine synthase QueE [Bacteroidetes bacterium]|jgi:7-carboxy-7-deazaguanine synthase|nr:7-carboxy-7-deazaguanine synthase QueE [Bacteroidota bacterium]MBT4399479.1 7-carboxy-7-deazaguanine synthase QueE [Bacteroidota bacterium]MBT4408560.1 7-carboxy-7-deazaguanine synthase QueE [Bacteroidota bacterium]MBT5426071.1 7-carboxy-7-deazaguanine synthase QueE [Bacteroidota bacterium]MBT7094307.1 7-carboxy-7-deazaguanine synthase QueE [Bacteroidota bacterium]